MVQYLFSFDLSVLKNPFIYAAFTSFYVFYLFSFKFKNAYFSWRSDSHWTILSEKLFLYNQLYNQIYRIFHAFFTYYPVRWFIMWYETYHSGLIRQKISPLLTFFINNAMDLFVILLFCYSVILWFCYLCVQFMSH